MQWSMNQAALYTWPWICQHQCLGHLSLHTVSSQWQWCLSPCLILTYSFWGAQSQKVRATQKIGLGILESGWCLQ